jgi:hypothetical protein
MELIRLSLSPVLLHFELFSFDVQSVNLFSAAVWIVLDRFDSALNSPDKFQFVPPTLGAGLAQAV